MRCKICKHKTTWDESYGRDSFIVCPSCHKRLAKEIETWRKYKVSSQSMATEIILEIGYMIEERKEK